MQDLAQVLEKTCHFAVDSVRLDDECKSALDDVALQMRQAQDGQAMVIGYTDSTGNETTNQLLSEHRARAAKEYIVTRHGIDPSRINVEGRGDTDPIGDNSTAAGRALNRRAVIRLTLPRSLSGQ